MFGDVIKYKYMLFWRFIIDISDRQHALIGITRQTLNQVPHNQHKMRITQAMSNPLEYLLACVDGH